MDDIWPGIMLEPAAVPAYGYSGASPHSVNPLDDAGVAPLTLPVSGWHCSSIDSVCYAVTALSIRQHTMILSMSDASSA